METRLGQCPRHPILLPSGPLTTALPEALLPWPAGCHSHHLSPSHPRPSLLTVLGCGIAWGSVWGLFPSLSPHKHVQLCDSGYHIRAHGTHICVDPSVCPGPRLASPAAHATWAVLGARLPPKHEASRPDRVTSVPELSSILLKLSQHSLLSQGLWVRNLGIFLYLSLLLRTTSSAAS